MLAGSCIWSVVKKYQNGTAEVAKKPFNMGRSGTLYVAMVTELLSSYSRAHLIESYCKVSNISDTNWLRYFFSSYLNKIWLSVRCHHLAHLHIFKTWISLERKEIFENSKQNLSAYEVYLFMFQNGLDSKDAIFVIVPLKLNAFGKEILFTRETVDESVGRDKTGCVRLATSNVRMCIITSKCPHCCQFPLAHLCGSVILMQY